MTVVRLLRTGGFLFIGLVDEDFPYDFQKPRLVYTNTETQVTTFTEVIGTPDTIVMGSLGAFYYDCKDPVLEKSYREAVSADNPELATRSKVLSMVPNKRSV